MDALKKHDKISFCVYDEGYRKEGEWALNIKSVVVFGRMRVVNDLKKVVYISDKLSRKFTKDDAYIKEEIEKYASQTLLLELTPEHICGKLVTEA